MAPAAGLLRLAALFAGCNAVLLGGENPPNRTAWRWTGSEPGSARAGAPLWYDSRIFSKTTPKHQELGERIMDANEASPAAERCEGFVSYGDFTWCNKVMPAQTEAAKRASNKRLPRGFKLTGPVPSDEGKRLGSEYLALSFGIRERDMWSELLSNRYGVPSVLYDCFYNDTRGPMGSKDISAKAQNFTECPEWTKTRGCYDTTYEARRECLGPKERLFKDKGGRSLQFHTLKRELKGRAPLSVYLKVDVEGAEWDALEWLAAHDEELGKIRVLDMEAHLDRTAEWNFVRVTDEGIERRVHIMETLSKKLALVGSTIASYHRNFRSKFETERKKDPAYVEAEPSIYNKNGFYLSQYCVSFVNPALL